MQLKPLRTRLFSFSWLFFSILVLTEGCSERQDVVATFGKHTITLEEFRIAYLELIKQPNLFDSKELRERFLDDMIGRRLLAEEARKLGLHKDEKLAYRLNAYRNKCLRDVHYQKIIKPKIKIREEDIRNTYTFTQEQRRVKHLFTETRTQADSLYQLLEKGRDFNGLASSVFSDTLLANSGGDLGWVYWDQLEYDLAMTTFKQPVHTYSKPVKSRFGYHIVQVTDFKKNPLLSKIDYQTHQRKTKIMLEYKIGEKIAQQYVEKMISVAEVQIYPKTMEFVGQKLAEVVKRKPNPLNQMSVAQLKDEEIRKLELCLWDVRNETLAILNGNIMTVGEFMSNLNYIPYQALYQSYKTALDFTFRDFLLIQEARDLGFDRSDEFRQKAKLFEEHLLESKFRTKLIQEIVVTEDEILDYFHERVVSKNKEAKNGDFHDFIDNTIRLNKKRKIVPDFVNRLSEDIQIVKHVDKIHAYYDGVLGKQNIQP